VDEQTDSTGAVAPVPISACIIARDEAELIGDCLASVSFCPEIVLIDSGSTDATVEIARTAGAVVIEHPWRGFAAQRNVALDNARGAWVLEIDADERVTAPLRAEIEAFLADPPDVRLAGLPVREIFLGRPLGPSAKYPKYRHRLVRRGSYRHDESRTVHEGFVPDAPVHPFASDLEHLLAASWREALSDAWRYARLESGQLRARRTPAALARGAVVRPAVKFLYRLTVDGGWRDGGRGVAKIAIDCATDAVVWARYAVGAQGPERGDSGVDPAMHYGAWKVRRGPARIVGVAAGHSAAAEAARWLERAAEGGADVSLIAPVARATPGAPAAAGVRVRSLERLGPMRLIRALDAEEQLRTIDAVVPFGRRARALVRVLPRDMRGPLRGVCAELDPGAVRWDDRDALQAELS
jgi:hypothetical protein